MPDEKVTRSFDKWWPDLESKLANLPDPGEGPATRSAEEMTAEILELVREIRRGLQQSESWVESARDRYLQFLMREPARLAGIATLPDPEIWRRSSTGAWEEVLAKYISGLDPDTLRRYDKYLRERESKEPPAEAPPDNSES